MKKIFSILLILSILSFVFMLFLPQFELENSIASVGSAYIPQVKTYNLFKDLSKNTTIKSNVNVNKVGKYNIECKIKYLFLNIKKTFLVEIKDDINPTINLIGNNPATVCPNHDYIEEGYKAIDNYEGDITDKVIVEKKDNSILYTVFDSYNNSVNVKRDLVYEDNEKPIISLNGNTTISLYQGNNFTEPGYTASDNCDGDITNKVLITSNVDSNKVGTYTIKYEVTDSNGNISSVNRTVIIKKKITYLANGKIYLTFDDGASHLTNQILDILDEQNVKATFFVVNPNETTKRAYNSGHAIGLHSNTHNYSYIYSSTNNYFEDLNNISNKVYSLIGISPKIIRFPGGSSNTISRNYQRGIMSILTEEVKNRGYIYFDWNIDSNDAGRDINNSEKIYYNVINSLSPNKTNVVLMHDSYGHDATVIALKNIIKYAKDSGYTFDTINENTPQVVHSVNN